VPFATFSIAVDASVPDLWGVLVEKVENPGKYTDSVDSSEILERDGSSLVRKLTTVAGEVTERITISAAELRIDSEFVQHPQYTGSMVKKITRPQGDDLRPTLTYSLDWEPTVDTLRGKDLTPVVMAGVKHTKDIAESL
jgi:hypothetical protein